MCSGRHHYDRPSSSVLKHFGLRQEARPLSGGSNQSWIAGQAVLKPCRDPEEWAWMADQLPRVKQVGYRLPLPLRANNGQLVVDGWCAQTAVEGSHPESASWDQVLSVSTRFHEGIAHLSRPAFLDNRDDPWALGDRVAWDEAEAPSEPPSLRRMLDLCKPLSLGCQIVHGDLAENVLFAEGLPPAVIDFSPYWRPAGFAAAIVVADAVCWRDADPKALLEYVSSIEQFPQLLVRALIYRMVTTIAIESEPDLSGYDPGIEMAIWLAT